MFSAFLVVALTLAAPLPGRQHGASVVADAGADYRHLGATPPPHGLPEIRSVWVSTTNIRAGSTVSGRVETSDNVAYVEARIEYRAAAMHRDGNGRFSIDYKVPWWLPPWLRHAYTVQVIARSVDGVELWRPLAIVVH